MTDKIQTIDPGRVLSKGEQENLAAQANMLAKSDLIPDEFKNRPANCALALDIAHRLDVAPLAVARGMYVTRGRVGWYAEFMLGLLNKSGVLRGPVEYEEHEEGTANFRCRVYGVDAKTGEQRTGQWVSWALVKANKWDRNEKYQTMTQTMFRRRALALFVRDYYPEILFGVPTQEELDDTLLAREVEVREASAEEDAELAALAKQKREQMYDEADVVDVTPEERPLTPEENEELDLRIAREEEARAAADQAELNWGEA
jgi:hypothetical protein